MQEDELEEARKKVLLLEKALAAYKQSGDEQRIAEATARLDRAMQRVAALEAAGKQRKEL